MAELSKQPSAVSNQARKKLAEPSPGKKYPKKEESLIARLRKAELSPELLLAIFDKVVVDEIHTGEICLISSQKGAPMCVFRGRDLLKEAANKKDWTKILLSMSDTDIERVEVNNPTFSQAYKSWRKSPTVTKAREILGLNREDHPTIVAILKLGRLQFFRPKKTLDEQKGPEKTGAQ